MRDRMGRIYGTQSKFLVLIVTILFNVMNVQLDRVIMLISQLIRF